MTKFLREKVIDNDIRAYAHYVAGLTYGINDLYDEAAFDKYISLDGEEEGYNPI